MVAAIANGEHRVRMAGIEFHPRVEGKPGAPWLTFSHSLATDLGMWDAIVVGLSDRFRILRYDARGHGRTGVPDAAAVEATNFDRLVADAVGLLDHFGIARTDFIGVSLGGMTALGIGLAAPDRIRSLTVIGARADMPAPAQQIWAERIEAVRAGGLETQLDSTLARWFTPAFKPRAPEELARIAAMIRTTPVEGYVAAACALRRLDYVSRLGAIRAPTLILSGTVNEPMLEPARAMATTIPGARFAGIGEASHLVPVEQPAAVLAHLEEFLANRP
jgi:3-oxoadipate enol-lactonase